LDAPALRLAGLRFRRGGGVIELWAWGTGRLAGFAIARHERRPLLLPGMVFTAQSGLMNVGTSLTSAAHGSVVLNLYAVHTVVLAHFLIPGDRLRPRGAAGLSLPTAASSCSSPAIARARAPRGWAMRCCSSRRS